MHIAQQMPLPLTISCSSKSRLALTFLVLPFWYLLTRVVPDILQKSSKTVVCVCSNATLGLVVKMLFLAGVLDLDFHSRTKARLVLENLGRVGAAFNALLISFRCLHGCISAVKPFV